VLRNPRPLHDLSAYAHYGEWMRLEPMRTYLAQTLTRGADSLAPWIEPSAVQRLLAHHLDGAVDAYRPLSIFPPAPAEAVPSVAVSVILATRNRAALLQQALESLARQETAGAFTYEIIVADNGSTDHTPSVVRSIRSAAPVTYLRDERPGKPYAVNTALSHARGAVIALTDDDIIADPGWLLALWRTLQETNAEAIAGRILPLWVDGRPSWATDHQFMRLGGVGCVDFGPERFDVGGYRGYFWWVGGNIAIRREVFVRMGGYDERLLRGQDVALLRCCQRAGVRIMYEPRAVVRHQIGRERLTPAYFRFWNHRTGYYRALVTPWQKYHLLTVVPWTW
jgi:glycosyltransferase involved in cell wall biosynthesis